MSVSDVSEYLNSGPVRAALGVTGTKRIDVSPLASGEYNMNYVFSHPDSGKRLVLRINMGSQMHLESQISYEADALKLLESSGRTPHVYFTDAANSVLVMDFLPGRPLRYGLESDLKEAAAILADIHGVSVPEKTSLLLSRDPLEEILDECEQMFSVYERADSADSGKVEFIRGMMKKGRRIAKKCSSAQYPVSIINTELNSGNFLMNDAPGMSYLIDWEKPLIGDPAQDLGHFLAPTTTFWKTVHILTPEQIDFVMKSYISLTEERESFDALWNRVKGFIPVTCLRGITWCAMAWVEYQAPGRACAHESTRAKLDDYLSWEFLEKIDNQYL